MESYKASKPIGHEHEGLQAVPFDDHPEPVPQQQRYYDKLSPNSGYIENATEKPLPREGGRGAVCGLRKPTFFLVVLLALAVIAIAVVGGVLGTRKTSR
jgi:hypothetical protein